MNRLIAKSYDEHDFIEFFLSLQLRYLQTLNTIAAEKNSTIVFPLPMEIMAHFKRDKNV